MKNTATLRRWAVPAAIGAAVISVGVGATLVQAGDGESLPPKTAAQLLTDVQNARIDGLSGTVVTRASLGLPAGLTDGGGAQMSSLLSGSKTMRVWYGGPERIRGAILGTLGESDFIRNGADVWTWSSEENTATHTTLPADYADTAMWPPKAIAGEPITPDEAAESVLAAISGTTEVATDGTAEVAGRPAYELVLKPKDPASTIGEIRLAVDGETSLPLRTQIFGKGQTDAAFEIAFARVIFETPPDEHFTFTPPQGVEMTEMGEQDWNSGTKDEGQPKDDGTKTEGLEVIGEGWTAVVEFTSADIGKILSGEPVEGVEGENAPDVSALVESLPQVSGTWGSGRVFTSALVNALITDDGRILVGAVTTDKLVEVAGR
ncbi:LolA family protein [Phytomonospora endophytica]|uniref:Outer membrane lipoprotein-sorting protein n=1 Tax=Phytomonospora endophytica TaxID=714109 RepID=A0A841FGZ2_9ACTN|nr:hypothetical protein [Phytomonospora endophytica]MBB6032367.1 outer membrane lipoprotein-sorting protein [Phytomonospora endophytica]GIG68715.1 hypothetical protein Pen01_50100 [Phytomonospora endophytica]